ncbi:MULTISPECIES: VOC family protein [unclassified Isoptericola]|uniref:VOC family protein n=1 Tax=unclassified Isoptericola TaxID=2623355 RepID=UPI0035E7757A|nr:VOC family protein [Isoptericola sp. QY 916]
MDTGEDAETTPAPPGRGDRTPATVVPYLAVRGAAGAIDYYRRAFGAQERFRIEDDGVVGHAELAIGGATIYLSDEWEQLRVHSPTTLGGWSVSLAIEVEDVDAFVAHLVGGGARLERGVDDGPEEGWRSAWVVDPYGHRWHVSSPTAG